MTQYKNVDEYVADAKPAAQPLLKEIREFMLDNFSNIEEKLYYGVPSYHYKTVQLVGIAAFTNHVTVGPGTQGVTEKDREALKEAGYTVLVNTFQIKFDQPIPAQVLQRIIRAKIRLIEAQSE